MSGFKKISQIPKYVWEYSVNLTDISQEMYHKIQQNTNHDSQNCNCPYIIIGVDRQYSTVGTIALVVSHAYFIILHITHINNQV